MASATCRALNPDVRRALAKIEQCRRSAINNPEQLRGFLDELCVLGLVERFLDSDGVERFRPVVEA